MTRHEASFARLLSIAIAAALMLTLFLLAAACGRESESDGGGDGADTVVATATSTPPPTATAAPAGTSASEGVSLALQAGLARYLIREELASVELPFDAIGETSEVSGAFTFTEDGDVVAESSRIVMNAASLRSDEANRDRYLRNNAIQTATYPEIVFVATGVSGLAWPLPTSGDAEFTIEGNLTVREVTRPVEWQTIATFDGNTVSGAAKTNFTFGEFEMEVPDLWFIVSLEDNIRLELDFVAGW